MAIKEQMNNPKLSLANSLFTVFIESPKPSQMGGHWKIPKIAVKIAQIR
ncbi:MAG: hypothetical protein RL411_1341 [Bacteroidota bacterium]|jgi:hypothetical protein